MSELPRFLFLLLSILMAMHSTEGKSIHEAIHGMVANIAPSHPQLLSGSNLTLMCTLANSSVNVSSADLYFSSADVELQDILTRQMAVLNSTAIQTVIWNVHLNMSLSRIACRMQNVTLDEIIIKVDDLPWVPNKTDCIVLNWSSMVCTWVLPKSYTYNVTLTYSRECFGRYYKCPHQSFNDTHGQCKWLPYERERSFLLNDHCLRLHAKNSFGNSTFQNIGKIKVRQIGMGMMPCRRCKLDVAVS